MERHDFFRAKRQVVKVSQKYQLYAKWNLSEADQLLHFDFVFELNEAATDRNTLEVPTFIEPTGYILVKLPSPQSMGAYWYDDSDKNDERYKEITTELCDIAEPDYLIGVKDGYASYLMWSIWD